jgi:hypothetical protein
MYQNNKLGNVKFGNFRWCKENKKRYLESLEQEQNIVTLKQIPNPSNTDEHVQDQEDKQEEDKQEEDKQEEDKQEEDKQEEDKQEEDNPEDNKVIDESNDENSEEKDIEKLDRIIDIIYEQYISKIDTEQEILSIELKDKLKNDIRVLYTDFNDLKSLIPMEEIIKNVVKKSFFRK